MSCRLVISMLTPLSSRNTRLSAPLPDIWRFHSSRLLLTSGTLLFRSMERLLFINASHLYHRPAHGFITYRQLEPLTYLIDRDIWSCPYHLVNILHVCLAHGRLPPTLGYPGLYRAGLSHLFSKRQTVLVFTPKHSSASFALCV